MVSSSDEKNNIESYALSNPTKEILGKIYWDLSFERISTIFAEFILVALLKVSVIFLISPQPNPDERIGNRHRVEFWLSKKLFFSDKKKWDPAKFIQIRSEKTLRNRQNRGEP